MSFWSTLGGAVVSSIAGEIFGGGSQPEPIKEPRRVDFSGLTMRTGRRGSKATRSAPAPVSGVAAYGPQSRYKAAVQAALKEVTALKKAKSGKA